MDTLRSNAGHCSSSFQFNNMDENRNFEFGVTQNLNQYNSDTSYTSAQGHIQYRNDTVYTFTGGGNKNLKVSQFSDFQRRVLDKMKKKTSFVRQMCDQSLAILGKCKRNLRIPKCKWNPVALNCKQEPVVEDVSETKIAGIKENEENLHVDNNVVIKDEDISVKTLESDVNNNVVIKDEDISVKTLESDVNNNVVIKDEEISVKTESDGNNNVLIKDEEISEKNLRSDKNTMGLDANSNVVERKGKDKVAEYGVAETEVKEIKTVDERHSTEAHSKDYVDVAQKAVVFCLQCKSYVARQIFPLHLKGRRHRQMAEENKKAKKIDKDAVKPPDKEGAVLTKVRPLIKRIEVKTKDKPVRKYTRAELLELQNVPASKCIPDNLEKDFIVDGVWDAVKFNAFHQGVSNKWKTYPRKRPAELLRDILQEEEIPGKRRKLEDNQRSFSVEGEVHTRKQPFIKRIEETVKSPVRQYTREELLELQNAAASRCLPASLEQDFKDFIVNGIWDAGKFNAFHKGVSWNIKHSRKRPAELLRDILQEEGILGKRRKLEENNTKSTSSVQEHRKKKKNGWRKSKNDERNFHFDLPSSKCPLPTSVHQKLPMNYIQNVPYNSVYTFVGDMKVEVGDMKTEVGDKKTEVGDMKAEVGDMKAVEDSQEMYSVSKIHKTSPGSEEKCMRSVTKAAETLPYEEVIIIDTDEDENGNDRQHEKDLDVREVIVIHSGDTTDTECQGPLDRTVKTIYCSVCKSHVDSENWPRHMRGNRHRLKRKKKMESRRRQNIFKVCIDQLKKEAEKRKHEHRTKKKTAYSHHLELHENERRKSRRSSSEKENVERHKRKISTEEKGREKHTRIRSAKRKTSKKDSKTHQTKASSAISKQSEKEKIKQRLSCVVEGKVSNILYPDSATVHRIENTEENPVDCNDLVLVTSSEDNNGCFSDQVNSAVTVNLESDEHPLLIATPYISVQVAEYTPPNTEIIQSETPASSITNNRSVMNQHVSTSDKSSSYVMHKEELSGNSNIESTGFHLSSPTVLKENGSDEVQKEGRLNAALCKHSSTENGFPAPESSVPQMPRSVAVQEHSLVEDVFVKTNSESDSKTLDPGTYSDLSDVTSTSTAIPDICNDSWTDITCHDVRSCVAVFPWGVDRNTEMLELHHNIPCKLAVRIEIPEKKYPWINYSERLHDPSSNTLEHIQRETGCQIQLKGIESEILNQNDEMYSRIYEDLHILIESYGEADVAFEKLAVAIGKIKECMNTITQDAINNMQMHEQAMEYNPQNYNSIGDVKLT